MTRTFCIIKTFNSFLKLVNQSIFGSITYLLALIMEIFGIISVFKKSIKLFVIFFVLSIIQIAITINGFGLSIISIWRTLLIIFMSIYFIYDHKTSQSYDFV
jgi:hypothetical protein